MQRGRGGKGLASRRQKANHRKGNLRRRTDLSMDRETDAEKWLSVGEDAPIYGASRRRARATEAPREAVP